MREPNAGVACRTFNDSAARFQQAFLLGIFNDVKSSSVLNTPARILEFCFAEDVAAGVFGEGGEFDERCVANGTDQGVDGAL